MKGNHVEYMGWSFDIAHRYDTGARLFNVRYKGVRIVYELGLSEAFTAYSGVNDVIQSSTVYADSIWGLVSFELVKGVDVPSTASCLNATFNFQSSSSTVIKNAVCVFESNAGTPLRRHHEDNGQFAYYGGLAQTQLIVR